MKPNAKENDGKKCIGHFHVCSSALSEVALTFASFERIPDNAYVRR